MKQGCAFPIGDRKKKKSVWFFYWWNNRIYIIGLIFLFLNRKEGVKKKKKKWCVVKSLLNQDEKETIKTNVLYKINPFCNFFPGVKYYNAHECHYL